MQRRVMLLAIALLVACSRASQGPLAVISPAGGGTPVTVALEVVADPASRQQGLMWRQSLPEGHGMLFVFDEDADHAFWMKNTLIPLDMLFIAREAPGTGRVVGIQANAKPHSTASLSVGTPSRWVLEVPGGFAAKRGLRAGDRVELHGVPAG